MFVLVPMDSNDEENAQLVSLQEVKQWCLIEMDGCTKKGIAFYNSQEDIKESIGCVIVASNKEYVWPFIERNIAVLIAPYQKTIEDIMEAFVFKELYDMNI
jgi:uncharacterized protein YecA (UPF0149 family)